LNQNHYLNPGDVLLAAKGSKNFATMFRGHFSAVASTTFLVSRLRRADILPEYLVWYLNNPETQARLKHNAIGSSIVSISKSTLADLEITIPPLDVQRRILEIARLSTTEHNLRLKIADLRRLQVEQQIHNAIK
jgi:restriction endonuclease S subunit